MAAHAVLTAIKQWLIGLNRSGEFTGFTLEVNRRGDVMDGELVLAAGLDYSAIWPQANLDYAMWEHVRARVTFAANLITTVYLDVPDKRTFMAYLRDKGAVMDMAQPALVRQ